MAKKTETKAKTRKVETTKPGPKKVKAKGMAGAPRKAPTTAATEAKEKQDDATTKGTQQAATTAAAAMATTETPTTTATPTGSPDTRLPANGTVLQKRDRQGAVRCECVIVDGGVKYRETVYRSLSAAAVAAAKDLGLAAKAMNGFTFWGLTRAVRKGTDPVAQLEKAWTRYWLHLESTLEEAKGGEHREPVLTTIQRHARVLQNLHDEVA